MGNASLQFTVLITISQGSAPMLAGPQQFLVRRQPSGRSRTRTRFGIDPLSLRTRPWLSSGCPVRASPGTPHASGRAPPFAAAALIFSAAIPAALLAVLAAPPSSAVQSVASLLEDPPDDDPLYR